MGMAQVKRAKKKKYYRYRRRGYNLEFEQVDEHGFWSKLNRRQVKAIIRASDIVFDRQYKKPEWTVIWTQTPPLILAEGTLLRPVRSMGLPAGTKVMLWAY
jgi:hypothetical protein